MHSTTFFILLFGASAIGASPLSLSPPGFPPGVHLQVLSASGTACPSNITKSEPTVILEVLPTPFTDASATQHFAITYPDFTVAADGTEFSAYGDCTVQIALSYTQNTWSYQVQNPLLQGTGNLKNGVGSDVGFDFWFETADAPREVQSNTTSHLTGPYNDTFSLSSSFSDPKSSICGSETSTFNVKTAVKIAPSNSVDNLLPTVGNNVTLRTATLSLLWKDCIAV
ncbi:hypothetical protein N431DRAFT_469794 [Stipitochalara longipes BDJ]|nr:hypothetical protein N431DRAFT_469794 [Stipitochalara longipes BDJ]